MTRTRLPLLLALLVGCTGTADDDDTGTPVGDDDDAADDDDAVPSEGFEDVTVAWGVDFFAPESPNQPTGPTENGVGDWIAGGGGLLVDLTGDDYLDLLVTAPHGPNALWLNDGAGTFELRPDSGLEEGPWILGATALDLDNDGLRDVLLLSDRSVRYFHNEGGGAFVDRGAIIELGELERPSGIAAADHDGDGIVDLFLCVYGRNMDIQPRPGVDRFLRGLGDGQFEDVTSGIATDQERTGQCFQASWLDLEGDGVLEAHTANDFGDWGPVNRLYSTEPGGDPWQMSDIGARVGADAEVDSMGGAVADINGDGSPEITVSHTDHRVLVLSYDPDFELFTDVTAAWGARPPTNEEYDASWAMVLQDMDNDGDLDLISTWSYPHYLPQSKEPRVDQANSLLLWDADRGIFEDASDTVACEVESWSWRAALTGDIDKDGALDVVFTSNIGPTCVLRGVPNGNQWLEVKLDGPPGNPDGLGATIEVRAGGASWSRLLAAGNSGLHSDFEHSAWFGLGARESVDEVIVNWPHGGTTRVTDVAAGATLTVSEP